MRDRIALRAIAHFQLTPEIGIAMQTELLKVTGMTCGGCTGSVTRALKAVSGVSDANVSLSTGVATVLYDEKVTSPDQLKSVVKEAGYGVHTTNSVQEPKGKGGCCG